MSLQFTRSVLAVTSAAALALSLAACGSGSGNTQSTASAQASGTPVAGGSIIYGTSSDPICVDPNQTDLTGTRDIVRQVADSVVEADPETGEILPWLATKWEVNDDATAFTFTFRTDATFSNGEKFDAAAFKTFLDGIKDLGGRAINAASYIAGYQGTEVLAADQAKVTFSSPNASFLQALSTVNLAVLAPSVYRDVTPEDRCLGKIVGSGPFTLDSFVPAQEVVLSKRTGYAWQSPNATHTGDAYLDKITFRVVTEASQRTGGLKSKTLDGFNSPAAQDEDGLAAAGFQILSANNPGTVSEYLTNNSSPTLKDPAVREAIQLGINNEEVRDTILLPRYNLATSILSSTTPLYTDFSSYITYDPEKAKKVLDAAGWVVGSDGIRSKDGVRLSVQVVNGQSGPTTAHELRAQQLKEIGVELTIKQVSRAEMLAALDSGDYDFVPYGFTRADPAALNMHFTTKLNNPLHLQPSVLDDYLAEADASPETAARQAAVDKAVKYILENHLVIVFNEQSVAHALSPNLHDVRWEPGVQISFYDAWLSK